MRFINVIQIVSQVIALRHYTNIAPLSPTSDMIAMSFSPTPTRTRLGNSMDFSRWEKLFDFLYQKNLIYKNQFLFYVVVRNVEKIIELMFLVICSYLFWFLHQNFSGYMVNFLYFLDILLIFQILVWHLHWPTIDSQLSVLTDIWNIDDMNLLIFCSLLSTK